MSNENQIIALAKSLGGRPMTSEELQERDDFNEGITSRAKGLYPNNKAAQEAYIEGARHVRFVTKYENRVRADTQRSINAGEN